MDEELNVFIHKHYAASRDEFPMTSLLVTDSLSLNKRETMKSRLFCMTSQKSTQKASTSMEIMSMNSCRTPRDASMFLSNYRREP
jgi:hypothetical protein